MRRTDVDVNMITTKMVGDGVVISPDSIALSYSFLIGTDKDDPVRFNTNIEISGRQKTAFLNWLDEAQTKIDRYKKTEVVHKYMILSLLHLLTQGPGLSKTLVIHRNLTSTIFNFLTMPEKKLKKLKEDFIDVAIPGGQYSKEETDYIKSVFKSLVLLIKKLRTDETKSFDEMFESEAMTNYMQIRDVMMTEENKTDNEADIFVDAEYALFGLNDEGTALNKVLDKSGMSYDDFMSFSTVFMPIRLAEDGFVIEYTEDGKGKSIRKEFENQ